MKNLQIFLTETSMTATSGESQLTSAKPPASMKVYFKNLNAIRFIAAVLVVLYHAHNFVVSSGASSWPLLGHVLKDAGRMGVNLFFVLSGFLISYLLLREQKETGYVNLKYFYLRRILRTWPLYLAFSITLTLLAPYALQLIGQGPAVTPSTLLTNLVFVLLFAVNIQLAFFTYNSGIPEITWSVCVEEQFYLVWPLLLSLFRKRLMLLFALMLGTALLSNIVNVLAPVFFNISTKEILYINYQLLFDKLGLFGGGMLAAWLLNGRRLHTPFFTAVLRKPVQWLMLALMVSMVFSVIRIPALSKYYFDNLIQAGLFSYLMLMAVSPHSILKLEHPLLKALGRISYGIYLFHTAVCKVVLMLMLKACGKGAPAIVYELLYPLAAIICTCMLAYVSYELFEKHFLKRKMKYAVVPSRM
ncbi:MAG TPA: acyltransferase [Chitinophaga sp.]|uniref:acyltransferase family protein n=1 Tax=Chitinophaga sp. TaxID=1869181 RepID=UPI002B5C0099|nr:acyltransferase [Chitinophaga sp.]HVI48727.1 acyltransferase [Chitinophaga sp.]